MKYRISYRVTNSQNQATRAEVDVVADSVKDGLNKFIRTNPFSVIYNIIEIK